MTELRALDIHSHIVPEQFPAYTGVGRNIPWPSMAPAHACHCHVMIQGKAYRTVHQSCWLSEERLRDMDKGTIARAGLDAGTTRAIVRDNAERFLGRTLEWQPAGEALISSAMRG